MDSPEDEEDEEDEESVVFASAEDITEEQPKQGIPEDTRTPEERTAELLQSMETNRKLLTGALAFCCEKQTVEATNAYLDELKEKKYTIYSAADFTRLLQEAGALALVAEDGTPAEEVVQEPQTVVIDGVEYLENAEPVQLFWLTTEAGQAALDADRPEDRMHVMLAEHEIYLPVIKRVLELCATEGGATVAALGAAVDSAPIMKSPKHLYVQYFIDQMEKCDAITWERAWKITDVGRTALAELDGVEALTL